MENEPRDEIGGSTSATFELLLEELHQYARRRGRIVQLYPLFDEGDIVSMAAQRLLRLSQDEKYREVLETPAGRATLVARTFDWSLIDAIRSATRHSAKTVSLSDEAFESETEAAVAPNGSELASHLSDAVRRLPPEMQSLAYLVLRMHEGLMTRDEALAAINKSRGPKEAEMSRIEFNYRRVKLYRLLQGLLEDEG